ncbi:5'-3' exonuclease [Blattabacterium cuenoti]|uniref:5'-3' exonuclease n=1 Tax=Blattabacterium cuenoti TaxID=1653831 RepID=UPI00163D1F04|nr:5'-3' exonuclease H3TH domain-containing protein [Blattabacterium cuenoti]
MKKKLFLIDAFSIIYQSYYAYNKNPLLTSFGLNTSPIIKFMYLLMDLLMEENSNYMAVIFDSNQENFRKKKYEKYKANRKKTPIAIQIAIPYILKILKAFKILFIYSNHGYEADDIIGTISHKAENKGYIVYIISLDKDFLQLVTNNIKVYFPPFKGNPKKILEINDVKNKFGIDHPKQVIDLWSMMGDYSDNIPGLPGIGEKNAKKFLKKFGSIEELFNSINQLDKKIGEKIRSYKKMGLLFKQLITIHTNIPYFNFNEKDFYIKKPTLYSIQKIFEELEFRRLLKKVYQYYKKNNNYYL